MTRLALVCVTLLGVVMLIDGGGGGSAAKKHSRCHGLHGIAWICNASAAAPTRAQRFGDLFQLTYNIEAKANKWPHRVTFIACKPNGEAIFDCKVKLIATATGRIDCGVIVIDTGFNVWQNHKIRCAKLFPKVTA